MTIVFGGMAGRLLKELLGSKHKLYFNVLSRVSAERREFFEDFK